MILELDALAFGYGDHQVGAGVSLTLRSGETLCLLGPNGTGKTTLFKTMLGLRAPLAGRVLLDGIDIATLSRREIARRIAYVPQAQAAFFPFRVHDVVLMGRASRLSIVSGPGKTDRSAAEKALATLGIEHLSQRIYTEISGGERQLVLIARALAGEARLLLMDEPTASLDFGNQARVLAQIRRLSRLGIAVVLSTHDPGHAFQCADRVALLHEGGLVGLGSPVDTVTPETLRLLYGVEVAIVPLPGEPGMAVCSPRIA